MKTAIFILTFFLFSINAFAGDVWVNGYTGVMEPMFKATAGLSLISINGITMGKSHRASIPITHHIHLTTGIMIEMAS